MRSPLAATLLLLPASTLAHVLAAAPAAASATAATEAEKVHRVEKLSDRAYAILARGGNIVLFLGEREAVLVDSQFDGLVPGLLETIASVTDKPLKLLVNTHHHGDHVGGNARLAPRVQAIVAHANVRARMEADQEKLEPERRGGLPTLVLGDRDPEKAARLDIELPGLGLHVAHRRAAHTDGDLLVGHPADHVLHVGDVMFLGILPFVDVQAGGGSFEGVLETVTWLASWVPEDSRIVPGHGPVCGKKELVRYRDFLSALKAHASANAGKSSKELADSFDATAWPEWKPTPGFVTWETLFDAVTGRGPGRAPR